MRKGTLITLIVLFLVLVGATIAQLSQDAPSTPYPGPVSGTPLPSGFTTIQPSNSPDR
jgi:hypothetical protein